MTNLFGFDELAALIDLAADGAHDLPYEDVDGAGAVANAPYRRLIEHVATLFRGDTLGGALPLGTLESRAIVLRTSYKKALTAGLAKRVFVDGGKLTAAELDGVLAGECGYVHLAGDADWWIPAGRIFYAPATAATAALELRARDAPLLPALSLPDPFHRTGAPTETAVTYDVYDLLTVETRDPLGNVIASDNHYRVLAPRS